MSFSIFLRASLRTLTHCCGGGQRMELADHPLPLLFPGAAGILAGSVKAA